MAHCMKIPLTIRHIPVHDKVCMHQDSLVGNATWNVSAFLPNYSLLNFFVDLRPIKDVERTYLYEENGKYLGSKTDLIITMQRIYKQSVGCLLCTVLQARG